MCSFSHLELALPIAITGLYPNILTSPDLESGYTSVNPKNCIVLVGRPQVRVMFDLDSI